MHSIEGCLFFIKKFKIMSKKKDKKLKVNP